MRHALIACILLTFLQNGSAAEIFHAAELSVRDFEAIDRDRAVVVIPGGLFEEHGPYLPSFTDGYFNQALADGIAEHLLGEGYDVLMFPIVPIGSGSPEDFGALAPFSGSYTVRPETLRSIFMDLGSALGDDGFQNIFVVHLHGAPGHNRALLDAADYFDDHYDGQMVPITALLYAGGRDEDSVFSAAELEENGLHIHAGAKETSRTLYLQPNLVHADVAEAAPFTAMQTKDLVEIAKAPDWLGYFGSPRLASAAKGKRLVAMRVSATAELASMILDGFDWRSLPNRGDVDGLPESFIELDKTYIERFEKERQRQIAWLERRQ